MEILRLDRRRVIFKFRNFNTELGWELDIDDRDLKDLEWRSFARD